jgi:GTPase Era involved in 16S rRNA processing
MSRRLRILLAAVSLAALLWLLLAAAERALALAQRFIDLPAWLQWIFAALALAFVAFAIAALWWLLRPRRARAAVTAPDRATLEQRIERLRSAGAASTPLAAELGELDRRRAEERIYVALFGEISTGKSSLIRSIAPQAAPASDVRGGTTGEVAHYDGQLPDGRALCLADVPGSREVDGMAHETLAREEALRAHAVVYLCAADLTRTQDAELRWLADFGKPMLLALNKADQWNEDDLRALLARLRQQTRGIADEVVAISAGGQERFARKLADGRTEQVERQRQPSIDALTAALARLVAPGASGLEALREQAVLAGLHERTGALEASVRAGEAERIVERYSRRAIVGAMAAVAPGSDLIIQGALATGLTRALANLYDVPLGDVQIEDFLRQARLTLRTGSSIVLAIAGNALKAFPGLGTLGGGVLHAFAYALIFDSLGKALSASLAERRTLDQDDAGQRLKTLLTDAGGSRLRRLASLTAETLRKGDAG